MASGKPNSSPIKNCEECMELFKYKPAVEKKGNARFCSRICQSKWQSKERLGSIHSFWKGDDVGYVALHSWVARRLGKPMTCQNCDDTSRSNRSYQWANLSHKYKRDLSDWARLCASCHKLYDNNKIKLKLTGVQ